MCCRIRRPLGQLIRSAAITAVAVVVLALFPEMANAQVSESVDDDPNSPYGPGDRVVALTFDDGPNAQDTPAVLRILERYGVPATFFVIGTRAQDHPELLEEMDARRQSVANHTWSHPQFPHLHDLSDAEIEQEIATTHDVIWEATEQGPPTWPSCLRPPGGRYDDRVVEIASSLGFRTALWTTDPEDWRRPGVDTIVQRTLDGLEPGAVILLHDGTDDRQQTVDALPQIIEGIRAQGYQIVPWCRPPPPFPDIWAGGVHAADIERLEQRGVTDGVGNTGEYRPHDVVTRGQMATFLWRTQGEPTGYPDHGFPDVSPDDYYDVPVRWLAAEGITDGVGSTGEYRPGDEVTRGQIATFLWRTVGEPTGYPDHAFPDVSDDDYYDSPVRWLTGEGITHGYHDGYSPRVVVPRDQTASFLVRTFGSELGT